MLGLREFRSNGPQREDPRLEGPRLQCQGERFDPPVKGFQGGAIPFYLLKSLLGRYVIRSAQSSFDVSRHRSTKSRACFP